jgi:NADH:ubiquinone oxidoreductase subunit 2 (subunit N)
MFSVTAISYFSPVVLITLWAMVLLLLEAFFDLSPSAVASLALAGLFSTALITLGFASDSTLFWGGMCKWDGAAKFFDIFFLVVAGLAVNLTSCRFSPRRD